MGKTSILPIHLNLGIHLPVMEFTQFEAALNACAAQWAAPPRLRLAPTPSGFLHAGNQLNFRLNAQLARLHPEGRLLLRIDDLDNARKRPEYVQNVFDTLQLLGIQPDEGPVDSEDFEQNWSQSLRLPLYHAALERLRADGHLFACGLSRTELAVYGNTYPPALRNQGLSLDQSEVSWRIKTPPGFALPDFVVRRRDGIPAYQVASVVDDLHFKITHVIRGADLLDSTLAQKFLATCLGADDFQQIVFLHHPLLLDAEGRKLSKSGVSSSGG